MEKFFEEITGRTEEHLIWSDELESKINKSALIPLITLKESALSDGLDLKIASGFRGFSRQEEIWNRKMRGETTILDKNHKPIDAKKLNQRELVFTILKWSAIPGTSRHHWGTDFDFFDGNTLGGDYRVQLIAEEYLDNGIFNPLYLWLKKNAAKFGFYFPYNEDRGGVGPEPWHLSYFPQAKVYQERFTKHLFLENLRVSTFEGKEILFKEADLILKKFILNTSPFNSIS